MNLTAPDFRQVVPGNEGTFTKYWQYWLSVLVRSFNNLFGSAAYTTTNVTESRTFDADTVSTPDLADVVGTLIADLKSKGLLS